MALCAIDIGGNSWQDCVFAPEWKVIKCGVDLESSGQACTY